VPATRPSRRSAASGARAGRRGTPTSPGRRSAQMRRAGSKSERRAPRELWARRAKHLFSARGQRAQDVHTPVLELFSLASCVFFTCTRTRSIYAVHRGLVHAWVGQIHPGELVFVLDRVINSTWNAAHNLLKWGSGYFGVKSAKVYRVQMGTKPAKVGRLGPRCAKVRRGLHPAPTGASAKKVFDPRREQSC
jgi:hypothetical protein